MNTTRLLFSATLLSLATLLPGSDAEARAFRVAQLPNGAAFGCTTCHETRTGGPRNPFGTAVFYGILSTPATAPAGWGPLLAGQDSDFDGFTNGQELGDPEGTWAPGDPNPTFNATNPGDPTSFPATVDPDAGTDTGGDTGVDPDTTVDPDTSVDPDTTVDPDTSVDPDTTVDPDTSVAPDTTTEDAATTTDTGTSTGTTDDRKVKSDDGCAAGGNSASLLGLLGLALLVRRRRA